jgi:hypothetical protein
MKSDQEGSGVLGLRLRPGQRGFQKLRVAFLAAYHQRQVKND